MAGGLDEDSKMEDGEDVKLKVEDKKGVEDEDMADGEQLPDGTGMHCYPQGFTCL